MHAVELRDGSLRGDEDLRFAVAIDVAHCDRLTAALKRAVRFGRRAKGERISPGLPVAAGTVVLELIERVTAEDQHLHVSVTVEIADFEA